MQKVSPNQPESLRACFPLEPYDIQLQISSKIYSALNDQKKKLMIVQSPTGTGKSYSLLVPTLAWLNQNKYRLKSKNRQKDALSQNKKIPAFLIKKQANQQSSEFKQDILRKQREQSLSKIVDLEDILKANKCKAWSQKTKNDKKSSFEDLNLDESDDDTEESQLDFKRKANKQAIFLEKELKIENPQVPVKIIFVSRTHSQLQQAIKSAEQVITKLNPSSQELLALTLGSKNLLCCNSQVRTLATQEEKSVEEKCQYLLSKSSCPHSNNHKIKQLFGKSVSEANKICQQIKLCGYYSLRNLIDCTDVIFLPYTSIVDKDIRSKIGININNSIIIFDESHNLLDFIKNSRSSQISSSEVKSFAEKASLYLDKYGDKLKAKNRNTLQHLVFILNSILASMTKFDSGKFDGPCQNYVRMSLIEMMIHLNLREIRIQKIKSMLKVFDYDKKISFFDPQLKTHHKNSTPSISVAQIHKVIDWIEKLYRLNSEDMIVIVKRQLESCDKKDAKISFKLHCLNSDELSSIITSSRLTILAGGTIEPLDDFQNVLSKNNHEIIKVGHIIKPDQCKIRCINKFEATEIRFNHQSFNSQQSLSFLKKVIATTLRYVVSTTPQNEGIIVFIQNYRFLTGIKEALGSEKFFDSILFDSQIVKEDIFDVHSKRIAQGKRSILISVMGGKLSQGINFSDDLARKLIVFGLPYANIKGPEIVQQMKYYDGLGLKGLDGKGYYESLCLKAINQTIGRAIRHGKDWAEIFLVDKRFEGVKGKLSEWMRRSVQVAEDLEELIKFS